MYGGVEKVEQLQSDRCIPINVNGITQIISYLKIIKALLHSQWCGLAEYVYCSIGILIQK